MLPDNISFRVRQQRYEDFLREAERERLIRTSRIQQPHSGMIYLLVVSLLRSYILRWSRKLQKYGLRRPLSSANCSCSPETTSSSPCCV